MDAGEDAEVVERYLRGDADAVALVAAWLARAAGPFRRRLGPEWEEAVQEARLEAFRTLRAGRFRGEARLRTYLGRLACLTCLDVLRRLRRRPRIEGEEAAEAVVSPGPSPLELALRRESERSVLALLDSASRDCRELWRMILRGLSYREMAESLGVSEGALRVRVHRCRKRALEALAGNAGPSDDDQEEERRASGVP